jgi:hypothetical protein
MTPAQAGKVQTQSLILQRMGLFYWGDGVREMAEDGVRSCIAKKMGSRRWGQVLQYNISRSRALDLSCFKPAHFMPQSNLLK